MKIALFPGRIRPCKIALLRSCTQWKTIQTILCRLLSFHQHEQAVVKRKEAKIEGVRIYIIEFKMSLFQIQKQK